MKPLLKYVGGKARELKYILSEIPSDYDKYIEPFVGGGALYFYLEPNKAIINDINSKLIDFYIGIKEDYDIIRQQIDKLEIIYQDNWKEFDKLKDKNPNVKLENKNEDLYYYIRDLYNHDYNNSKYHKAVLYYFINKTAYTGMMRHNSKGEFNVAYGRYRTLSPNAITKEHSDLLQSAKIYNKNYKDIFSMTTKNDFMFIDPPYLTTFHNYGNLDKMNSFDRLEHIKLANEFKKLKCKALMIIGKTQLIEDLYGDYIVGEYEKNYSVNIRNRFKSSMSHLIVKNY